METWIKESNMQFSESVSNWREAIILTAKPLLESNKITLGYVDTMIKNVEELGDYIVLVPRVAMPHARPEKGSLATDVSFLILKEPVVFSKSKNVQLIICLSTINNEEHLEVLQDISALIDDDKKVDMLINCKSSKEFAELAKRIISEEE